MLSSLFDDYIPIDIIPRPLHGERYPKKTFSDISEYPGPYTTRLLGGGSTGSPMGVTYAEVNPPSTLKSVPCNRVKVSYPLVVSVKKLTVM